MTEITLQQVKHRAAAEQRKIRFSKQPDLFRCLDSISYSAWHLADVEREINAALPLLPGAGPLGEVAVALNDAITMVVAHYTAEGTP